MSGTLLDARRVGLLLSYRGKLSFLDDLSEGSMVNLSVCVSVWFHCLRCLMSDLHHIPSQLVSLHGNPKNDSGDIHVTTFIEKNILVH